MKLSIITINYNNLSGLTKTLESIWAQSFKNFEHVLIDGASSDGSSEFLKNHSQKFSHWVSEPDTGIYDAMNKGILKASGEYLLFLNSGDCLFEKDTLEKALSQVDGSFSFYYGNLVLERSGQIEEHKAPAKINLDFMLNSTFWHPCVFIQSSLFKKFGLYRTEFKITGDYEFFIRCLLKAGVKAKHLPFFISVFDGSGISNSSEHQVLQNLERKKSWLLNMSKPMYLLIKTYNRFTRSRYGKWLANINVLRKN